MKYVLVYLKPGLEEHTCVGSRKADRSGQSPFGAILATVTAGKNGSTGEEWGGADWEFYASGQSICGEQRSILRVTLI